MSIEDFVKERETPYSKITAVTVNDDGTVSYTEKYDLTHPLCPVVKINDRPQTLTLNQRIPKFHFEIIHGSVDYNLPENCAQNTRKLDIK